MRRSFYQKLLLGLNGPQQQQAKRQYAGGVEKIISGRFGKQPDLGIPGAAAGAAGQQAGHAGHQFAPSITVSPARKRAALFFQLFLPTAGAATLLYGFMNPDDEPLIPCKMPPKLQYLSSQQIPSEEVLTNWSATHEVKPKRYFQPESESDIEEFLQAATEANQKLRVVGSGLSPNGLGFSEEGVLSMALLDKIIKVDKEKMQVTVQAGARVQQVVDALAPHGLTLQNFASIRDQQIGGYTQVGAHGTGARLPPVDDQIVSMRLVTPGVGPVTLSPTSEPELFQLAKVGLGGLGVVSQVTLQCVPRHKLVERTFSTTISDVKKNHVKWLQSHKHLRYMWLPYTDRVVVVQADPEGSPQAAQALQAEASRAHASEEHRLQPFRDLLKSAPAAAAAAAAGDIASLSATQLRDALLAANPTDKAWVAQVNKAEAEYWSRSSGIRTGWSDEILGFDCGGQQWVMEAAFPVGQLDSLRGTTKDIEYMEQLLKEISSNKIPAPCPIEQRWSSGSSSSMSPVAGPRDSVHSWVGIIMYLPQDESARDKVTQQFRAYSRLVADKLMPRYNATWHWGKLELPSHPAQTIGDSGSGYVSPELKALRAKLAARFPVQQYNAYREVLDPANILANDWLDALFPRAPAA